MTLDTLKLALELPDTTEYSSTESLDFLLSQEKKMCLLCTELAYDRLKPEQVDDIRVRFLGKKSPIQSWLKSLKNLSPETRKDSGARINQLKAQLDELLKPFLEGFQSHFENKSLEATKLDLDLGEIAPKIGSRHPIAVVLQELLTPFRQMGFQVIDGPELERDFYNFEALNIPKDHSAREMQDTFFLASDWVLRTHTSSVQVHAMQERPLPLKVVCAGYVYRNEYDLTHVPTFRQFECLVVDKGIHLGHMRHTLDMFFKHIFGRPVPLRLRSSYFPFTEPSCEIDVQCQTCNGSGCRSCKGTGWLEMGGCGLVNPNVLRASGIDPEEYSGFAFGMGIDRITMSRFAISDLRSMYEGDLPFLNSFKLGG